MGAALIFDNWICLFMVPCFLATVNKGNLKKKKIFILESHLLDKYHIVVSIEDG